MQLTDIEKREKWAGRALLWAEILVIPAFLAFRFYVSLPAVRPPEAPAAVTTAAAPPAAPVPVVQPDRVDVTLPLKRGNFSFFRYVPGQPEFAAHPKAVIIFGSGDGGFDGWEDRVCKALQTDGYEMIGYDCSVYAKTDYDLAILQSDMNTMAQSSLGHYGAHPPPLILGGWSMGAEQAVPAAAGPHPPPGIVGLLLISPGDRGRYGLRTEDRWDISPTGKGTFALADFGQRLGHLRIAQWNGNLDLMGSKSWLDSLSAPHRSYGFSYGLHDYAGASESFLALLRDSIEWILSPSSS